MNPIRRLMLCGGLALAACLAGPAAQAQQTKLTFYFPVAVGGAITKLIDTMAADFEKANPTIKVEPVYTGSYQDTIAKTLTALKSNEAPHFAILLSTDMFTLIDEDAIIPIDDMLKTADDKKWVGGFYKAFMENSQSGGKTWGVPFQRSTIVLYYNKDLFKEAGLDPETPPKNWAEQVAFAQKLTKRDAAGNTTQWGIQIPSSGFPYWLFQGLTTQNNVRLMNDAGNKTFFNDPKVVEALQYYVDLAAKHKVHPPGVTEWGTTPRDFFEKKIAMMWTTTGNLTNVRDNAKFPFGVAMLPAGKQFGSPTGGGNFYIFKKTTAAEREAAMKFIRFATEPERAAQWGIDTGYVAVRPDAFETTRMKEYVVKFPPAAVARDQLKFAWAEFSTHDNQRVTKALNDGLQAAIVGTKTPKAAMDEAQREATRVLRPFQR